MKKLGVLMIGGGGDGAFFGPVHRRAIALDDTRMVAAGVLRSSPEKSLEAAEQWGVIGYPDLPSALADYRCGSLKVDYATIVTPNNWHYEQVKACLEVGLPVVCEKPMTMTVGQAMVLSELVEQTGLPFLLAHTYLGHPMLMYARHLVQSGVIGEIRKIVSTYNQGWLATAIEEEGQQQASWRVDPQQAGISCCGGDIGSHAFASAVWVSGLEVTEVSATLRSFVGRQLDDDFNAMARLSNGGLAVISASQVAIGHKNDHWIQLFGDSGSLEWHQERAEELVLNQNGPDQHYWLGAVDDMPEVIASYVRLPGGHNGDFWEALGNLHLTMERLIRSSRGEDLPLIYDHPSAQMGLATMKFLTAAVASSRQDGAWKAV